MDFSVFGVTSVSITASGALAASHGWQLLNLGALALIAVIAAALVWLRITEGLRPVVSA